MPLEFGCRFYDALNGCLCVLSVQEALSQWLELETLMAPVAAAAVAIPAAALRQDAWNLLTVSRFLPRMLPVLPSVGVLLQPFSVLLDKVKPPHLSLSRSHSLPPSFPPPLSLPLGWGLVAALVRSP